MHMIVPYFLTMTPYMELSFLFKPCSFFCMFLVFEYCYLFFLFAHAVLDVKSLHQQRFESMFCSTWFQVYVETSGYDIRSS
jgi:hypothetical protein